MQRLFRIAMVVPFLLIAGPSESRAEGPFNGEWSGSAAAAGGRCRPAVVTLTVSGKAVTGEARFESESLGIHGTVREDGGFGATIGFQHLVGKFTDNAFEGTFNIFNCTWKMSLTRTR